MRRERNQELQALAEEDLCAWYFFVIWLFARWAGYKLRCLPFPGKLAIINTPLVLIMISAFSIEHTPRLYVPITWMAAYCLSVTLASFFPRPARRRLFHWVSR